MSDENIKIALLGDSCVGKTSLIRRFVEDRFEDNFISTIGVDYFEKKVMINNKQINLVIQDTSGEERFKSLSKTYYKNADGIIFVFDVTNKESFSQGIKYWLTESDNEKGENNYKKILVGNKSDLKDMRKVNKETAEKYSENRNMKYFETSAKTGENVDLIFKELVELILKDPKPKIENNKLGSVEKSSNKKKCC